MSDARPDPAAAAPTRSQRRARGAATPGPVDGPCRWCRSRGCARSSPWRWSPSAACWSSASSPAFRSSRRRSPSVAGSSPGAGPGCWGCRSPRGTTSVLAFGTVAAVLTGALTRTDPFLRWMPAALALSMLVAFLHQLLRRDGRPRLVESVVSVVTGLAVVVSGACLVPLALDRRRRRGDGRRGGGPRGRGARGPARPVGPAASLAGAGRPWSPGRSPRPVSRRCSAA